MCNWGFRGKVRESKTEAVFNEIMSEMFLKLT